jgi:hypothetical protein
VQGWVAGNSLHNYLLHYLLHGFYSEAKRNLYTKILHNTAVICLRSETSPRGNRSLTAGKTTTVLVATPNGVFVIFLVHSSFFLRRASFGKQM